MPMFKLGLTGSIATGKSTALAMFADLGYPTFCADEEVHALYEDGAVTQIKQFYAPSVTNNRVDRSKLADYLAKNPHKFSQLESLIHPLVQQRYQDFVFKCEREGNKLLIADIPLLLETNSTYQIDAVALTYCSKEEQRRRAFLRPKMTEEKFMTILKRQMDQQEKMQLADYLINTGGTIEQTRQQVVKIVEQII